MARVLIVGCGCRGTELGSALVERGHPVRGTSRDPDAMTRIEDAGFEPVTADPYRLQTLMPHIANIVVVCWLMGSAEGDVEPLHTTRLQTMLERTVDTMVRGLVYEAAGTVDSELLAGGAQRVRDAAERWMRPDKVVDADPADTQAWVAAMADAVERVLA